MAVFLLEIDHQITLKTSIFSRGALPAAPHPAGRRPAGRHGPGASRAPDPRRDTVPDPGWGPKPQTPNFTVCKWDCE